MAVDTKLEEWEADFSGSDDNTPTDDSTIGTTLGKEFRSLKTIIKKDLSCSQDISAVDPIVYTDESIAVVSQSTGKPYSNYKSISKLNYDTSPRPDYDLLATGLSTTYWDSYVDDEGMVGLSFQIIGDWNEVLFPGTPLVVSPDGLTKYAYLNILSAVQGTAPPSNYSDLGTATTFTFHPQLVPYPRDDETHADTIEFSFEIDAKIGRERTEWWLKMTRPDSGTDFPTTSILKGRRIEVIKMVKDESERGQGGGYPGPAAGDPDGDGSTYKDVYFPEGSYTLVMNGETKTVGDVKYIGLYYYAKDLAVEVDGMDSGTASGLFGDWDSSGPITLTTVETVYQSLVTDWIPSKTDSTADTKYVMRMSNDAWLKDPSDAGESIADPDSAYYLIGSQNGNRNINGERHDYICFKVTVTNAGENEYKSFRFNAGQGMFYQPGYLPLPFSIYGDLDSTGRGCDWRASVECVSIEDEVEDFELTPDISCPIISMNEWEDVGGSPWKGIVDTEANPQRRAWNYFTLKFRKAFTAKITYEIKITGPLINGPTPYKNVD